MSYKIGIDVGGTFTDFLLTRGDGSSEIYKVLSTPRNPSIATVKGLEEMAAERKLSLEQFLKQGHRSWNHGYYQCSINLHGRQNSIVDHQRLARHARDAPRGPGTTIR
jgi:hypothetical protein